MMKKATDTCGCCEGITAITPRSHANRPGLAALSYRVGTHGAFLETMKARLSSLTLEIPTGELDEHGAFKTRRTHPLSGLRTRDSGDPSIALLDAWATVGDVLSFYQERIANEGYLRTATERRSVLELARLVGYALRPGVAASVWLALELDKDYETTIQPYQVKAQSIPGPGELPQTFENTEPLEARSAWNELQPRTGRPQTIETITQGQDLDPTRPRLYLKGIGTNLKPNDVLLITRDGRAEQVYHVAEVKPDPPNDRTLVIFQEAADSEAQAAFRLTEMAGIAAHYAGTASLASALRDSKTVQAVVPLLQSLAAAARRTYGSAEAAESAVRPTLARIEAVRKSVDAQSAEREWLDAVLQALNRAMEPVAVSAAREKARTFAQALSTSAAAFVPPSDPLKAALAGLTKPPSLPPRNAFDLKRDIVRTSDARADTGLQLATAFDAGLRQSLPVTLANVKVTPDSGLRAYVFRAAARPFGHNAPLRAVLTRASTPIEATISTQITR